MGKNLPTNLLHIIIQQLNNNGNAATAVKQKHKVKRAFVPVLMLEQRARTAQGV